MRSPRSRPSGSDDAQVSRCLPDDREGDDPQVAPAADPDLGTPPPEPPYYGNSETLPVIDLGIEGHAAQRYAHEDRRDDGSAVGSAAPVL